MTYWDDLMNKRNQTQSLGGALNTQQPTDINANTFMGTGTQTSPTTDTSIMTTPPDLNPIRPISTYGDQSDWSSRFPSTTTGPSTSSLTGGARDARTPLATGTGESLGRSATLQNIMSSAPTPGSATAPYGSLGNNPAGLLGGSSVGPAGPGPGGTGPVPPTGLPTRGPELDDPMSTLDNNLRFPKQSITPEDVMLDPGFKWQQEQLGRRLEDIFAAKGRVGSTDYFNTLSNANQKLISDEYNRINNQQWERGMEMNRLLYDRRAQENITNYEREFRENERKYGREQAENILAYERAFREDARDYERLRYLTQLGFGATQASTGT